jgi:NitT/TauT family transport system permease protein
VAAVSTVAARTGGNFAGGLATWLARYVLPPVVTLVVLMGVWIFAASRSHLYVLPGPIPVWNAFASSWQAGTFQPAFVRTLEEAILGWAIGSALALPVGYLLSRWSLLERATTPYIGASQAVPVIAIAPLLLGLTGFGIESKLILAALLAFFPVVATTIAGLRAINKDLRDVARAFGANWWQTIIYLEAPRAARSILAGERIAIVLALVGAYVGELVNPDQGLGALVLSGENSFQIPLAFAGVIAFMFMGAILFALISTFERIVTQWTD